jgi:hypothetical protein
MVHESLCFLEATLEPAETVHFLMVGIKLRGILTRMLISGSEAVTGAWLREAVKEQRNDARTKWPAASTLPPGKNFGKTNTKRKPRPGPQLDSRGHGVPRRWRMERS